MPQEFGEFPPEFRDLVDGSQFLRFDTGPLPSRILIFADERMLRLMSNSETWYMDGTFGTSTQAFRQVYTVRVKLHNSFICTVYALLPNKTQEIYSEFFNELRNLCQEYGPLLV